MARWFSDQYRDAVWECGTLRPNEKLVALTYGKHAKSGDVAWVTWARLSQLTGIRSKDALNRAITGLVNAGWMTQVEKRRQHRSPRYRLLIPANPEVRETYVCDDDQDEEEATPEVRETDNWKSPEVRETNPEVRETVARGTRDVPDYSYEPSYRNSYVDPSVSTSTTPGADDEDPIHRRVRVARLALVNGRTRRTG